MDEDEESDGAFHLGPDSDMKSLHPNAGKDRPADPMEALHFDIQGDVADMMADFSVTLPSILPRTIASQLQRVRLEQADQAAAIRQLQAKVDEGLDRAGMRKDLLAEIIPKEPGVARATAEPVCGRGCLCPCLGLRRQLDGSTPVAVMGFWQEANVMGVRSNQREIYLNQFMDTATWPELWAFVKHLKRR